jgi:hypothetical protein
MNREDPSYVSFKDYIDTRIDAIDKATSAAYESMQQRLAGMNEFRESLKDQNNKYMSRDEVYAKLQLIENDIRILRESRAELAGKASQKSVTIAFIFSGLGILIALMTLVIELLRTK